VLNDRWFTFRVTPNSPTAVANFQDWDEIYATGYRKLLAISPDGSAPESQWDVHSWFPIPIRGGASSYYVYSAQNSDDWISGIAFGKNLWNHAYNSAVAFLWALNPQDGTISWVSENWNNDQLAYFPAGQVVQVSVPVIADGNDKLLYLVNHNDNWLGTMHTDVQVNGQHVERFRTSYDSNPFAIHFNHKRFSRYLAIRVPASLIPIGSKFVKLRVDMSMTNNHLYFRELGTHNFFPSLTQTQLGD